jgi:hypothetical protein
VTAMGSNGISGEPTMALLGNLLTLLDCDFGVFINDRTYLVVAFNHLFKIVVYEHLGY